MSHYTRIQVNWDDGDYSAGNLTANHIIDAAQPFITEMNWSNDILIDLHQACELQELSDYGFNRLQAVDIIEMFKAISQKIPTVTFFIRGIGEDFFDIWAHEIRNGSAMKEYGPFHFE